MKARGESSGEGAVYHHGDLRRHLIEVGERLLEERGVEGFTLRECARRAGVSPSAPSHHFGNVTGLLTAIATVGFDGLSEAQEAALVGAGDAPGARLRAIGGAYIRYALAHPGRFRVAFGHMPLNHEDPDLVTAGTRALEILRRELRALRGEPTGQTGDRDFDAAVALAWSAVHGFARLLIDGQLFAVDPSLDHDTYLNDIADRTLELLIRSFVGGSSSGPKSTRRRT